MLKSHVVVRNLPSLEALGAVTSTYTPPLVFFSSDLEESTPCFFEYRHLLGKDCNNHTRPHGCRKSLDSLAAEHTLSRPAMKYATLRSGRFSHISLQVPLFILTSHSFQPIHYKSSPGPPRPLPPHSAVYSPYDGNIEDARLRAWIPIECPAAP